MTAGLGNRGFCPFAQASVTFLAIAPERWLLRHSLLPAEDESRRETVKKPKKRRCSQPSDSARRMAVTAALRPASGKRTAPRFPSAPAGRTISACLAAKRTA